MIGPSRHAACLTYGNKIVCIGTAQTKTHPMMKEFSKCETKTQVHAEVDCLIRAVRHLGEDLSAYTMYVLRISRGQNVSMSKPCPICQKAIEAFGIKDVHWSIS